METELQTGAVISGYRIEGVAGRGGMGVVYRATQIALDRPVALKLLAPELAEDDAFRERFQRESRLLAATDHPNVITIHEAGEDAGRLFIAMRYVQGTDLRALMRSEGKLDVPRATALLAQVAAALDAAHARGLIHRDVKPANVLIEQRVGREHAYLTDFGLTKAVGSTGGGLTATGQFVGTVDFIAPEQVMGQRVDARADVYSLGCVLYTVLTGRVPFERDSEVSKIFAHVNDPPPSLLEASPDAPVELDEVVRRALDKDPAARFQSAGDLGRAAAAAAEGRPMAAPERTVAAGAAAPDPGSAPPPPDVAPPPAATLPGGEGAPGREGPPGGKGTRVSGRRRWRVVAGLVLVAAAAVVALVLLSGGGSEDAEDALNAVLRPQPISVHGTPTVVTVGEGHAWVASIDTGKVTPIEPNGNKGKAISVGDAPSAIASGDGVVLVTVRDGSGISRIDAGQRRRIGITSAEIRGDGDLAFGDHAFWGVMSDNAIARMDVKTGGVVERLPTPTGLIGRLAFGAGSVWAAADLNGRPVVLRVDPDSRKVRQVPLDRKSYAQGIAFGEGVLWVADSGRNRLLRIDPATNRIMERKEIEEGIATDDIAIESGAIWYANTSDPPSLLRFDPTARDRRQTPIEAHETSELAVGMGAAWLTLPDDDVLTRFGY